MLMRADYLLNVGAYGGHYYEVVLGDWLSNGATKAISAQRLYRNVLGHSVILVTD